MADAIPHPGALLCESCGYPLAGLLTAGSAPPPDLPCPECAHPIAQSLPERRPGSPWQQKRTLTALVRTGAALVSRPVTSWDDIRVEGRAGATLVVAWALIIGALTGASLALWLALTRSAAFSVSGPATARSALQGWLIIAGAASAVVLVLTCTEAVGIRIVGRLRRWRITWPVAFTVVGHAAIGWALLPITLPIGLRLVRIALTGGGGGPAGSPAMALLPIVLGTLGAAVVFAPMFAFEALVYAGMRRLRFANLPRRGLRAAPDPRPESPLTDNRC